MRFRSANDKENIERIQKRSLQRLVRIIPRSHSQHAEQEHERTELHKREDLD